MDNKTVMTDDADMDMLPAWATPVILAFMLVAGPVFHDLEKNRKPRQPQPECKILALSRECK